MQHQENRYRLVMKAFVAAKKEELMKLPQRHQPNAAVMKEQIGPINLQHHLEEGSHHQYFSLSTVLRVQAD